MNRDDYIRWLLSVLDPGGHLMELGMFDLDLFHIFLDTPFQWPEYIPMDSNRAMDGIDLRSKYITELNLNTNPSVPMLDPMDGAPCSILEMLISFSKRIEDNIMYDPEKGDRSYIWFNEMIVNLGITVPYRPDYVKTCLIRFNTRTYEPDGKGGLFKIGHPYVDARKTELWQQAQIAINERGL